MEALKTGTVQKITAHNPSNGIVADLIESAVGKVGIMIPDDQNEFFENEKLK